MQGDAKNPIFSAAELKRLAVHPGDVASAALAAGEIATARALCAGSLDMHRDLGDGYWLWITKHQQHVIAHYGLETFHAMLPESIAPWLRPLAEQFRNGVTREAIGYLAQIWRMACPRFGPVHEDADRITIDLHGGSDFFRVTQDGTLWTSGGALSLDRVHATDGIDPVVPLLSTAILHAEALMIDWLGYPPFTVEFDASAAPARLVVQKDPSAIPHRFFLRAGKVPDRRLIRGAVDAAGGLLFGRAELSAMAQQAMTKAVDAIDRGDLPRAIGWCQLSKGEWYPTHHILRDWITAQMGFVYTRYGADALYAAVGEGHTASQMEPMIKAVAAMDLRTQVEVLAAGFRQHAMRFRIEEHEDRFAFVTEPCGSGGRLIQEGAYAFPKNLPKIRERHKAGFYLEDFPVYCTHCPSTNEHVLTAGGPQFLLVDGDLMNVPDGNCTFYIFKDPDAVPDRFFRRAGLVERGCRSTLS